MTKCKQIWFETLSGHQTWNISSPCFTPQWISNGDFIVNQVLQSSIINILNQNQILSQKYYKLFFDFVLVNISKHFFSVKIFRNVDNGRFILRGISFSSQPSLILLTFRELKYLEFWKVFNIVTLNSVMMWTEVVRKGQAFSRYPPCSIIISQWR